MKIELLKNHLLTETEMVDGKEIIHNVTNHPGSVLDLPAADAAALIASGTAKEYVAPDTSAPEDAPAGESSTPAGAPGDVTTGATTIPFDE